MMGYVTGGLAGLSFLLLLWQWLEGRRFVFQPWSEQPPPREGPWPGVTLLKPLKGREADTEKCLRSWLEQDYPGPIEILFAVASAEDPAVAVVEKLRRQFLRLETDLIVCGSPAQANAKVAKLAALESRARHGFLIVSDADVEAPPGLVADLVHRLRAPRTGLAHCFYELANPSTLALRCEAVAINADFWSQVLQARRLKPVDFALGAVMATRRDNLRGIGGFAALAECLADDYQLGHRIAALGGAIVLSPLTVRCWSPPMGWAAVWRHQLRWARTIRVCQSVPYFFSLLSNATLWPFLWVVAAPCPISLTAAAVLVGFRMITAWDLQRRLTGRNPGMAAAWLAPIKDLLQIALWMGAFCGNRIEWRGVRMRLRRDGTLEQDPARL